MLTIEVKTLMPRPKKKRGKNINVEPVVDSMRA
jgi:hypothetical protein